MQLLIASQSEDKSALLKSFETMPGLAGVGHDGPARAHVRIELKHKDSAALNRAASGLLEQARSGGLHAIGDPQVQQRVEIDVQPEPAARLGLLPSDYRRSSPPRFVRSSGPQSSGKGAVGSPDTASCVCLRDDTSTTCYGSDMVRWVALFGLICGGASVAGCGDDTTLPDATGGTATGGPTSMASDGIQTPESTQGQTSMGMPSGDSTAADTSTGGTSTGGTSTGGTSTGDTSTGDTSTGGTTSDPSTSSSSSDGNDGVVFLIQPDGGAGNECDIYAQDCPVGEKCNAYALGGGTWNALGCFPVVNDPDQVGDACTAIGGGATGFDSCDIGSMCWDVDEATDIGTCVANCTGTADAPLCAGAGESCVISNQDSLNLCLPNCSPLLQDCDAGQGCYAINDVFTCAPDVSGAGGDAGDACEFINVCTPGLGCLPGSTQACLGSCCTPFCEVDEPNTCPGIGQTCEAWYIVGEAPLGFENVGVCTV